MGGRPFQSVSSSVLVNLYRNLALGKRHKFPKLEPKNRKR